MVTRVPHMRYLSAILIVVCAAAASADTSTPSRMLFAPTAFPTERTSAEFVLQEAVFGVAHVSLSHVRLVGAINAWPIPGAGFVSLAWHHRLSANLAIAAGAMWVWAFEAAGPHVMLSWRNHGRTTSAGTLVLVAGPFGEPWAVAPTLYAGTARQFGRRATVIAECVVSHTYDVDPIWTPSDYPVFAMPALGVRWTLQRLDVELGFAMPVTVRFGLDATAAPITINGRGPDDDEPVFLLPLLNLVYRVGG